MKDIPEIATSHSSKTTVYWERHVKVIYIKRIIDIFTYRNPTWLDGTDLTVVEFPEGSFQEKMFVIDDMAMTPYYFTSLKKKVLRDESKDVSVTVTTQDEMYEKLLTLTNSIGYLEGRIILNLRDELFMVKIIY